MRLLVISNPLNLFHLLKNYIRHFVFILNINLQFNCAIFTSVNSKTNHVYARPEWSKTVPPSHHHFLTWKASLNFL